MKFLLFIALDFTVKIIFAYPYGAPNTQNICDMLTPDHLVDPQETESPFEIAVSEASVEGGDIIQVEISSEQGRSFQGFYLLARSKDNTSHVVGEFFSVQGQAPFNFRNCGTESNNAVTHYDNLPKQKVIFNWKAPDEFDGIVNFE